MSSFSTGFAGLAAKRLGVRHLLFFTLSASAPMAVLAGSIPTTYAATGNFGVPLSFLILGIALALFTVGYSAMSRYVSNAAAFYAYIAHGLGRPFGVGGASIAVAAYNAVQIGLYGVLGAVIAEYLQTHLSLAVHWTIPALIAVALIGILGTLRINLNARVLAIFLLLEVLAILLFDATVLSRGPHGAQWGLGFDPADLFTSSAGAALALGVGAFIGFESGATYGEEVKDRNRTVAIATYSTLGITSLLYTASAWSVLHAIGRQDIQAQAEQRGPSLVFELMSQRWGSAVGDIVTVLLVTSVFAAALSFHNTVARYLFALGREGVLPRYLGTTSRLSGAPTAGSLTQTAAAVLVVCAFGIFNLHPILQLFAWFLYFSAIGILVLMLFSCIAVIGFFASGQGDENVLRRLIIPALGAVALLGITYLTFTEASSMLGPASPAWLAWAMPAGIVVLGVAGVAWGMYLKAMRPEVYSGLAMGGRPRFARR